MFDEFLSAIQEVEPAAFTRVDLDKVVQGYMKPLVRFDHITPAERQAGRSALETLFQSSGFTDQAFGFRTYVLPALCLSYLRDEALWGRWPRQYVPSGVLTDALGRILKVHEARFGNANPFIPALRGILDFIDQGGFGGFEQFEGIANVPGFDLFVRDSLRGAAATRPSFAFSAVTASDTTSLRPINWFGSPPGKPTSLVTLLFSGDDNYFRAFAPSITAGVLQHSDLAGVRLHFHIVDYDADASADLVAEVSSAARTGSNTLISFSSEVAVEPGRPYYAACRYLRLHEFLQHFQSQIIIGDMDVELVGSISDFVANFDNDRISLVRSNGCNWGFMPWRRFWAGAASVPFNSEGLLFAELVRGAIARIQGEGVLRWWTDQCALYVAHELMGRIGQGAKFKYLKAGAPQMRSSEEIKLQGLRRLNKVGRDMAAGEHWLEALRKQQRSGANEATELENRGVEKPGGQRGKV